MTTQTGIRRYVDGKLVEGELPTASVVPRPSEYAANDVRDPVEVSDADVEKLEQALAAAVPSPVAVPAPAPALPEKRPQHEDGDEITDTAGMRKFLIKQMARAARGEIDAATVKSVCSLAQQVYNATKLELDAARILKDSDRSIRALELTGDE